MGGASGAAGGVGGTSGTGGGASGTGAALSGGAGGLAGGGGSLSGKGGQGSGGSAAGSGGSGDGGGPPLGPVTLELIKGAIFYDGYAETVKEPLPEGLVRLENSVITTRLTAETRAVIQPHLELDVTIGARCDNYDRIGSVRLALADKGATSYDPKQTPRLEIARFITPFMNKNAEPREVSYHWDIDHVAAILRSPAIDEKYDFWLELSVFGVPYAANQEVAGCANRSDVFEGAVTLKSDSSKPPRDIDVLIPLAFDAPFNDYQQGASDQLGVTKKTLNFGLERDITDAELVFIISQHGANSGGEEYVRRRHFVRFDGELVLEFTPGRPSCEPFRKYNTQSNGIYGLSPRSDAEWQSFSNWCPGDVIDTRHVDLKSLVAGQHSVVFDVPDAVFSGDEGNFPLSAFVIGKGSVGP